MVMATVSNLTRLRLVKLIEGLVYDGNLGTRASAKSIFRLVEPSRKIKKSGYLRRRCFSFLPEHPN